MPERRDRQISRPGQHADSQHLQLTRPLGGAMRFRGRVPVLASAGPCARILSIDYPTRWCPTANSSSEFGDLRGNWKNTLQTRAAWVPIFAEQIENNGHGIIHLKLTRSRGVINSVLVSVKFRNSRNSARIVGSHPCALKCGCVDSP